MAVFGGGDADLHACPDIGRQPLAWLLVQTLNA
jgi:hypothetical protein